MGRWGRERKRTENQDQFNEESRIWEDGTRKEIKRKLGSV